jgi:peptide chain release factor 1
MQERLAHLEEEYEEVEARLADPEIVRDQERYAAAARRYKELEELVVRIRALRRAEADLQAANELYAEGSSEDRESLKTDIATVEDDVARLQGELRVLLLPKDPHAGKNVIVEIRGAEGGEEANLFARDLFEMYRAYAGRLGWKLELLGAQPSDLGGFQTITFLLRGDDAWTRMKHEGGPHRVQRVPITESQGRVHTSSATVTVLPEADEIEVDIDPNDLQVDVYRSSGPGGQSVNTTDSAVRITHKPSGIVVSMQDEKSQLQNKAKAMRLLRARLLQQEQQRQQDELSNARRGQIGGGGRSEKIRTYNFKENRLTDHRIGLTIYRLDKVLEGELDEVIDALVADERAQQLDQSESAAV